MEGRCDWGRYDIGTFRRRDVLTMGRFDCKAFKPLLIIIIIIIIINQFLTRQMPVSQVLRRLNEIEGQR